MQALRIRLIVLNYRFKYRINIINGLSALVYFFLAKPRMRRQIEPGRYEEIPPPPLPIKIIM